MSSHKGHTKYWRPYVRFSIDEYAIPLLDEYERKVKVWESLDQSVDGVPELVAEGFRIIEEVKEKIENDYFVAEDMCDEEGIYLDLDEYYAERIAQLQGDIVEAEKLKELPQCGEEETKNVDVTINDIKCHIKNCRDRLAEHKYGSKDKDFAALIRRNRKGE